MPAQKWRGKKDASGKMKFSPQRVFRAASLMGQTFAANKVWQKVPKPHVSVLNSCVCVCVVGFALSK
jgi:hypothetical protein